MKLIVKGYKSISSLQEVSFDGLTILAGANSSGKSSFMQPFLILKQTIEMVHDSGFLTLYGENIKFTDSSQIKSKVLGCDDSRFSVGIEKNTSKCTVDYRYKDKYGFEVVAVNLTAKDFPSGFILGENSDIEKNKKTMLDKFTFLKDRSIKKDVEFSVIKDKCFLKAEISTKLKMDGFKMEFEPAQMLQKFVKNLIHIPGLRGNPERNYKIAMSENFYYGSFEKYVAGIISYWVENKNTSPNNYDIFKKYLRDLNLASGIDVAKRDDTSVEIMVSRIKSKDDSDCVNIADVGFGVSQTIPILVALICAKKDQFIYVEQPELHLHPKAQFGLALIMADAVQRGVNVIVETHSSIFIRGIQLAVVNKKLDREKVSLNWFSQNINTGEARIDKATLDSYGAFGDWPEDFDDTFLNVESQYLDAVEGALELEEVVRSNVN